MFEIWVFNEEGTDAMPFGIFDTYEKAFSVAIICGGVILEI